MTEKNKSVVYAVSAVLLWSTVATAFKLTLEGMSYTQLVFYASFFSLVSITSILIFTGKLKQLKINRSTITVFLLSGLLNPFLYYIVLFKAYSLLPAQEAQPLNYTWPMVISLFSVFFLKEKAGLYTVLGQVSAFAGVVLIATRGELLSLNFQNPTGVLLALGSSVIWASFWIINLKNKRDESVSLFGTFFTGTIYSFLYMYISGETVIPEAEYIAGAAYIGFFEMGITFFLWAKALSLSTNRSKTATFAYLSPFLSFIFIAVILKETILWSSIAGFILIITGILIQNKRKTRKSG